MSMTRCENCLMYSRLLLNKDKDYKTVKAELELLQTQHSKLKTSSELKIVALNQQIDYLNKEIEKSNQVRKRPVRREGASMLGKRRRSYSNISAQARSAVKAKVLKYVGGDEANLEMFIADLLTYRMRSTETKHSRVEKCITTNAKVSKIIEKKMEKDVKDQLKDIHTVSLFYCQRKKALLGVGKFKALQGPLNAIKLNFSGIKFSAALIRSTRTSEPKVKAYLRSKAPWIPEVKVNRDEGVVKENAYVEVTKLFTCIIKVVYYTPKFHKHIRWFLNEFGQRQLNNFRVGGFSDTFPICGGAAATVVAAIFYNFPGLAQMPDFHFVVSFFKNKETSPDAELFFGYWDEIMNRLADKGLPISFKDAPDDTLCIPQTNIRLNLRPNSEWHFSFVVFGKGDHKSDQSKNGCDSSNMTYPSAHFKTSKEFLCHPDNFLDLTKLRTYQEKLEDFENLTAFKGKQRILFHEGSLQILKDTSLTDEAKQKKVKNLHKKLLTTEVNQHAAKLQTCIKDRRPYKSAHKAPICPLHTHCNGAIKWVNELIEVAAETSLTHKLASPSYVQIGSSTGEFKTTQMKAIPNLHIERNPNPQAPLLLAVQTFPEMGLSGLGKHFTDLYSESPETKEQEQESFSK